MRRTIALAATLAIALSSAGASLAAAPCRDAKGKFIKCPAAAAPAKPTKALAKSISRAPRRSSKPVAYTLEPMKRRYTVGRMRPMTGRAPSLD